MSRLDRRFWYECAVLRRRLPAAVAVAAVLAFPAAAAADSAGDNQYQDPFSNVPSQPKKKKTQSQQPATSTTPAPSPSAPATSTPTATTAAPSSSTSSGQLPRTGFPLLPVAAVGAALIGAGLGLRRLVSER